MGLWDEKFSGHETWKCTFNELNELEDVENPFSVGEVYTSNVIQDWCEKYEDDEDHLPKKIKGTICKENVYYCTHLNAAINGEKNFSSFDFDCSFLKSDLHHLYKTLNDASLESQKLAAISLCSAFFGEIAIYFYLLVIHHYNNELFFDSGKSIFTGFDGFGRGNKNKYKNNDPAYKKRKLRAEIELTSKNDEQNKYKNISKNDDD